MSPFRGVPGGRERLCLPAGGAEKPDLNMGGDRPVNTGASWFGGRGQWTQHRPVWRLKVRWNVVRLKTAQLIVRHKSRVTLHSSTVTFREINFNIYNVNEVIIIVIVNKRAVNKVPQHCSRLEKVAGSATYKQSKTVWNVIYSAMKTKRVWIKISKIVIVTSSRS